MVEGGGGWWRTAEPKPAAGESSPNLPQPPPTSATSGSPPHLHLNHAPVVTHLWTLLPKHLVIRHHFEVVPPPEVLQAHEITGFPIADDAIARVELLDPAHDLDTLRHGVIGGERIPAPRVHAGPAIVLIDVLGAHRGPTRPVHSLGVDAGAVRIPLKCAAHVEPFDGRDDGT